MRGLSMSSMGTESIISWSDRAFPTANSSILEPIRWVNVSLFLKHGRGRLETILFGLAGLIFSFLRDDPTIRFEWLSSIDAFVEIGPLLSPLYLRLGDGDLSVLLGREYGGLGHSGSLLKLFWRVRGAGDLDRALFCGVDPTTFGGVDCFAGAAIGFAIKFEYFWAWALVGASRKAFSLIELIRIICGFSLMHDHKNSLENDLSLEPISEDAVLDSELETVVALLVAHVREEVEEIEVVGEGGEGEILFEWGMFGVFGACEITSLSWTLLDSSRECFLRECFLGLHLLMQEPIWRNFWFWCLGKLEWGQEA